MDNTQAHRPAPPVQPRVEQGGHPPERRRRSSIAGILVRFLIALGVLGLAAWLTLDMVASRPAPPRRDNVERTFTVDAIQPDLGANGADIATFGEVIATRTVEIRAGVEGRVLSVSPDFRAGRRVEAGTVIATIDPYAYEGARVEAQAGLADARLSLREAREASQLQESAIETARASLEAASTDLARAEGLLAQGAVTQQSVDERRLVVAERAQALSQAQNHRFTLEAQITRQNALISQAEYALETAERNLADTEITAPFTGVVTAANVTEGGYATANESVGALYDVSALELAFTLADSDYGALSAEGLEGRAVTARWDLEPDPVVVEGRINGRAPQVDPATGGVELYATLEGAAAANLRPGTFVSVTVEGTQYDDTLRLPETAIYDNDHVYTIRDGRMAPVPVVIRARDGAEIIVSADIPEGEPIITTRLSQAGEGVAVRVEDEAENPGGGPGAGGRSGGGG